MDKKLEFKKLQELGEEMLNKRGHVETMSGEELLTLFQKLPWLFKSANAGLNININLSGTAKIEGLEPLGIFANAFASLSEAHANDVNTNMMRMVLNKLTELEEKINDVASKPRVQITTEEAIKQSKLIKVDDEETHILTSKKKVKKKDRLIPELIENEDGTWIYKGYTFSDKIKFRRLRTGSPIIEYGGKPVETIRTMLSELRLQGVDITNSGSIKRAGFESLQMKARSMKIDWKEIIDGIA